MAVRAATVCGGVRWRIVRQGGRQKFEKFIEIIFEFIKAVAAVIGAFSAYAEKALPHTFL